MELVNVPATFEKGPGATREGGRLILTDDGRWGWGQSSWFSGGTLRPDQHECWGWVRDAKSIHLDDGKYLVYSSNALVIEVEKDGTYGTATFVFGLRSEADGREFVQACYRKAPAPAATGSSSVGDLNETLRRLLRSRARVKLQPLVNEVEASFKKQGKTLLVENKNAGPGDVRKFVVFTIERLIDSGELKGFIDPATDEYVDREQAPKQHRVVTLDMKLEFRDLLGILAKGGIQVASIKCPACGAACTVPETGTSVRCSHCNSSLQVADVVKVLRDLLS
ncbi:MAG: hypothetical protein IT452_13790 [Planctomycetia bacterium]|nr:hypothetical protein [Planctomycetia bacterium]